MIVKGILDSNKATCSGILICDRSVMVEIYAENGLHMSIILFGSVCRLTINSQGFLTFSVFFLIEVQI